MGRRLLPLLAGVLLCACAEVTIEPATGLPSGGAAPIDAGGGGQVSLLQQTTEAPIVQFVAAATKTLDCEIYLVTDRDLAAALGAAAARGVAVRVMLETRAGSTELVKRQPGVQVLPVPRVTLDHSKSCVRDAGTPAMSVLVGTANWSAAASKDNLDFVVTLPGTDPAAQQVAAIIGADAARAEAPAPPGTLLPGVAVVSPFNSRALMTAFMDQAGDRLLVTSEELRDPATVAALTRAAGAHRVDVAAPRPEPTPPGTHRCQSSLYVHAKVMILWRGGQPALAFLGSENLSTQSLDRNREIGVIEGPTMAAAIWSSMQTVLTCPA
jgi:cardiolipin synthase A/B